MTTLRCVLAAVMMSACSAPLDGLEGEETDTGVGGGTGGSTGGGGRAVSVASSYSLQSRLDITAGSLAPDPAYGLLQDLSNDPGAAIVTAADAAGLPAAQTLFDALPSSLEDRLAGWLSDAASTDGLAELQVLVAWSQLVLAEVVIDSELVIGDLDQEQHAIASHRLSTLRFDIAGNDVQIDIPQLGGLEGAGHARVEVWLESGTESLDIVLGEQRYGLLLGEAAYQAFEAAVENRYGQDLRGMIGSSIDCEAIAAEVADQCVLGVCVDHESELADMCEGALDSVADKIHHQFRAFDMEVLRLASGEASIVDGAAEQSTVVDGIWDAAADLGQGLRSLPAEFQSAAR